MKILRAVIRFIVLLLHVLLGIGFAISQPFVKRKTWHTMVQWWLRAVVRLLGGSVTVHGQPTQSAALMVANHISWLDIPLLGGHSYIRFLSKQEVKKWPVIGLLATRGGTLYIERGKRGAAQQAAERIGQSLAQGDVVLVFPEGTTGPGHDVQPFHARLFASALDAGIPVQPVAIRYLNAQGEVCDKVPYIDDMTLVGNLLGLLGEKTLHMEIHYLPLIDSATLDRKTLAAQAEQQIRQVILNDTEYLPVT